MEGDEDAKVDERHVVYFEDRGTVSLLNLWDYGTKCYPGCSVHKRVQKVKHQDYPAVVGVLLLAIILFLIE